MKSILIGLLLILSVGVSAQIKWEFLSVQTDKKFFEIHLCATIDQPWHIYSQNSDTGSIAIPTKIKFVEQNTLKLLGAKPAEMGDGIEKEDKELGIKETYYEDKVVFIQPVKVKDTKTPLVVKGTVTYQLCTSEKCLMPTTKEFIVILEAQH